MATSRNEGHNYFSHGATAFSSRIHYFLWLYIKAQVQHATGYDRFGEDKVN